MSLTVYVPDLPCGRFPAQCPGDSTRDHAAHDWTPSHATHDGLHCYGFSTTTQGRRVGWAGSTETPGDAMDLCQNNPATTPATDS